MKSRIKTALIWIVMIGALIFLLAQQKRPPQQISVARAEFEQFLDQDLIEGYLLSGNGIHFTRYDVSDPFFIPIDYSEIESFENLQARLLKSSAHPYDHREWDEQFENDSGTPRWLIYLLLGLGAFLIFILVIKKLGGGANQNIFALRASKARVATEASKVRFDDIGGCSEAKQELGDIVAFLCDPQRWLDAGARLPRGILLEGPPGCGKTLLARAVAGETDAKFYYTSASEFVEMFIGVGPARARDMFETAKKELPAVLFIDELDAIGRRRGSGAGFTNEEREQTLNQILVCMDGFEPTDRIVVIAATNRSDILDKALVRAGRFDRRIRIEMLGLEERTAVFGIHTRKKRLAPNVSLEKLAAQTDGFSGADIEALCNLAALFSIRRTRDTSEAVQIGIDDFQHAIKRQKSQERTFDALDAVLLEATTQLAEPVARAVVRVTLQNGTAIEGDIVWVDPSFVKIRRADSESTCILPKNQILQLEALTGTALLAAEEVHPDSGLQNAPKFG